MLIAAMFSLYDVVPMLEPHNPQKKQPKPSTATPEKNYTVWLLSLWFSKIPIVKFIELYLQSKNQYFWIHEDVKSHHPCLLRAKEALLPLIAKRMRSNLQLIPTLTI